MYCFKKMFKRAPSPLYTCMIESLNFKCSRDTNLLKLKLNKNNNYENEMAVNGYDNRTKFLTNFY